MPKISIITDTDSSLPKELAEKYNILQVPISIHFDEDFSGTDHTINNVERLKKLMRLESFPQPQRPPQGFLLNISRKCFKEEKPDTLIYFAISSEMSATIKSAQIAATT